MLKSKTSLYKKFDNLKKLRNILRINKTMCAIYEYE